MLNGELKKGKALKKGDCIGITAPSFFIEGNDFNETIMFLQNSGYKVKIADSCSSRDRYFAGSDRQRAEDINKLFRDDSVDAIMCLRGGYGCTRILDFLDYDMIAEHPKLLIGYSDITALHIVLMERCGLATVHGPMVSTFKRIYSDYVKNLFIASGKSEKIGSAEDADIEEEGSAEDADIEEEGFAEDADIEEEGSAEDADIEEKGSAEDANTEEGFADGSGPDEGTAADGTDPEENTSSDDVKANEAGSAEDMEADKSLSVGELPELFGEDISNLTKDSFADMPIGYTVTQFLNGISSNEPIGEIEMPEGAELKTVIPGTAEGKIIGGNLTVLVSLIGTEYELRGDHTILFFEEVGEKAYRIDRMLQQVYQSGLFDRVDGILIGGMTEVVDDEYCTCEQVIEEYAKLAGKPCISGVPAGHGGNNMFLPFGVKARMTANEDGTASLTILESPLE